MIVDSCTLTMEDDLDMMEVDQNSLIPSNNNKGAGNDDHDRSRSMIANIIIIKLLRAAEVPETCSRNRKIKRSQIISSP